jgi:hypothetical protein
VGREEAQASGFLPGVFLEALALVLHLVTGHLEAHQKRWSGFPPVPLAELRLLARHPRGAHQQEARALQAKPEVLAAHGSLPVALWFRPGVSLGRPAASWSLPVPSLAQPTVLWFLPAA